MKTLLNEYLAKHYPARILFDKLQQLGNTYLIGGVLREIKDNGAIRLLGVLLLEKSMQCVCQKSLNK